MRIRAIAITLATVVGMLGVPAVAGAADHYNPPSQIPSGAQCGTSASSGSFGAFGRGQNWGNSTSGHVSEPGNPNAADGNGADGLATGDNNSDVCAPS